MIEDIDDIGKLELGIHARNSWWAINPVNFHWLKHLDLTWNSPQVFSENHLKWNHTGAARFSRPVQACGCEQGMAVLEVTTSQRDYTNSYGSKPCYPVFLHIKIAAIHRILVAWIATCIRHKPKRPSSMRCWGPQYRKQTATTWPDQRSKDANSKKLRLKMAIYSGISH